MKNRFYLTSSHGYLGSNVVWHRHNEQGYTTDIDQAHVYTREEAQQAWSESWGESEAISADHVDALAVWKVDCQYIPKVTQPFTDIHNTYVAFEKGKWDGNDVHWIISERLSTSTDFDLAYVMGVDRAKELGSNFIVIPFSMADSVKRRTFDHIKINRRVMVQGAGLKACHKIKQDRRRKENPMTRFHCPACGRISWQHNPHDFDGCKNVHCSEWSTL